MCMPHHDIYIHATVCGLQVDIEKKLLYMQGLTS